MKNGPPKKEGEGERFPFPDVSAAPQIKSWTGEGDKSGSEVKV